VVASIARDVGGVPEGVFGGGFVVSEADEWAAILDDVTNGKGRLGRGWTGKRERGWKGEEGERRKRGGEGKEKREKRAERKKERERERESLRKTHTHAHRGRETNCS
jgi:hypothetical protein